MGSSSSILVSPREKKAVRTCCDGTSSIRSQCRPKVCS
ncbi:hypothetical protein H206_05166 [Candidatus Electrothrix aarhusensis]|uniref:Uncharacterized protein n=1 Tax=Candidatus Electrothrix aarhusensis TaxID=1859131 RepID=A0A3S3RUE6_9BACT|nr:hypothetical protein H206_05166 [Candidatus Electrothrix aarhusensis]